MSEREALDLGAETLLSEGADVVDRDGVVATPGSGGFVAPPSQRLTSGSRFEPTPTSGERRSGGHIPAARRGLTMDSAQQRLHQHRQRRQQQQEQHADARDLVRPALCERPKPARDLTIPSTRYATTGDGKPNVTKA